MHGESDNDVEVPALVGTESAGEASAETENLAATNNMQSITETPEDSAEITEEYFVIGDRYGFMDWTGQIVIEPVYDSVTIEGSFIIAKSNGKYVCVDKTGKKLPEQSEYIVAIGNYVCFQKDGKQGLSDEKEDIL